VWPPRASPLAGPIPPFVSFAHLQPNASLLLSPFFSIGLLPCKYFHEHCCRETFLSILSGWIALVVCIPKLLANHPLPAAPISPSVSLGLRTPRHRRRLSLRSFSPQERPILLLLEEFACQFDLPNPTRHDAAIRVQSVGHDK